ncbi:hypothetical protein EC988_007703, partial [Linderina pennispora]
MSVARRVVIAPKQCSSERLQHLRLPHPRAKSASSYYADVQNQILLEATKVDMKGKRSWFGDNWVQGDGSLSILTPTDPLFIYLKLITEESRMKDGSYKFIDIDSLKLESHGTKDAVSLSVLFSMKDVKRRAMETLCEVQEINEETVMVKVSEDKVVRWLKKKCNLAMFPRALERTVVAVAGNCGEQVREEAMLREMVYLVAEYLEEEWVGKLVDAFGGFKLIEERDKQVASARKSAVSYDGPES